MWRLLVLGLPPEQAVIELRVGPGELHRCTAAAAAARAAGTAGLLNCKVPDANRDAGVRPESTTTISSTQVRRPGSRWSVPGHRL